MIYQIDGSDLYTTYGVKVIKSKGGHGFLKRKGETGHSWLDENGEEYFTESDDMIFEARDIVLTCVITAASQSAFETALNSFKAALMASGLRTLILPYLSSTLSVYYVSGSSVDMLTKWDANMLAGKFFIKLREPSPTIPT